MTETERKALALSIEVREDARMRLCPDPTLLFGNWEALCRAIEQHEAFRQEVSDAVVAAKAYYEVPMYDLSAFIIAKPDPLVEAMKEWWDADGYADIETFRAAIEKRGGRIIFDGGGA